MHNLADLMARNTICSILYARLSEQDIFSFHIQVCMWFCLHLEGGVNEMHVLLYMSILACLIGRSGSLGRGYLSCYFGLHFEGIFHKPHVFLCAKFIYMILHVIFFSGVSGSFII